MIKHRWRLKRRLMLPFSFTRFGEDVYEWLTAVVLETQMGMSRKWCAWFREHVVLCRRYGRIDFFDKRMWLFEPGWSLAPVILSRIITAQEILVTEGYSHLAGRYVEPALLEVGKAAGAIRRSAGVVNSTLFELEKLREAHFPRQILDACRARYHVGDLFSLDRVAAASADACFSMGRLEHFARHDLTYLLAQMHRILAPGGLASHIVDHRDHFWHYDKSIHCFHHLTFSDSEWESIARGRHMFRNRLLERDYLRLFEEQGFEMLAAVHNLHRRDAGGVDPQTLWGRYAALSPEDLEAAVSHFVVRRP